MFDATEGLLAKQKAHPGIHSHGITKEEGKHKGLWYPFVLCHKSFDRPIVVIETFTYDRTQDALIYMFNTLHRLERLCFNGNIAQPGLIITDGSQVELISGLKCFNYETTKQYVARCNRIVNHCEIDGDRNKTFFHLCFKHFKGTIVKFTCSEETIETLDQQLMVLMIFTLLSEVHTFAAYSWLKNFAILLFQTEYTTKTLLASYHSFALFVKEMSFWEWGCHKEIEDCDLYVQSFSHVINKRNQFFLPVVVAEIKERDLLWP